MHPSPSENIQILVNIFPTKKQLPLGRANVFGMGMVYV